MPPPATNHSPTRSSATQSNQLVVTTNNRPALDRGNTTVQSHFNINDDSPLNTTNILRNAGFSDQEIFPPQPSTSQYRSTVNRQPTPYPEYNDADNVSVTSSQMAQESRQVRGRGFESDADPEYNYSDTSSISSTSEASGGRVKQYIKDNPGKSTMIGLGIAGLALGVSIGAAQGIQEIKHAKEEKKEAEKTAARKKFIKENPDSQIPDDLKSMPREDKPKGPANPWSDRLSKYS